ncbi:MAG: DUF3685 domain-containing protein [Pseudanabaenaceae cyanobacterium]
MTSSAWQLVAIVPDLFWRSALQSYLGAVGITNLRVWHSYDLTPSQWSELALVNLLIVDEPSPQFTRELRQKLPDLPVLVLSDRTLAIPLSGIVGYCAKNNLSQELTLAISTLLSGRNYGSAYRFLPSREQVIPLSPWQLLQHNWRVAALKRIDYTLAHLPNKLPTWQRWIMAGRARELRAARWLISQVLFPSASPVPMPVTLPPTPPPTAIDRSNISQVLTVTIASKIREYHLTNLTHLAQEIDILRPEKRQELLLIALQTVENLLQELRQADLSLEALSQQLTERQREILLDVWQAVCTQFIGKHYAIDGVIVVEQLLAEKTELNLEVPQFRELILHLLKGQPLMVDNSNAPLGSVSAMRHAELLLENLILTIANGVIQALLNNFAHAEGIKRQFYHQHLLATREIERFRNNLSWKYRRWQYFDHPCAIFESRYRLLCLTEMGIRYRDIYAPRTAELEHLQGIPYLVTLFLELQDAIAPRLQALAAWLGSGIVYILTNIIGRGIGLIGKGVLQGIGSAFRN